MKRSDKKVLTFICNKNARFISYTFQSGNISAHYKVGALDAFYSEKQGFGYINYLVEKEKEK